MMKKSLVMMRAQPFCVSIKVFRKILKPFPWGVRAKADAVVLLVLYVCLSGYEYSRIGL